MPSLIGSINERQFLSTNQQVALLDFINSLDNYLYTRQIVILAYFSAKKTTPREKESCDLWQTFQHVF